MPRPRGGVGPRCRALLRHQGQPRRQGRLWPPVREAEPGLAIRFMSPVGTIETRGNGVRVSGSFGEIDCAAAILTAPLGVLAAGAITLRPAPDQAFAAALDDIRMGTYEKTVIAFDRPILQFPAEPRAPTATSSTLPMPMICRSISRSTRSGGRSPSAIWPAARWTCSSPGRASAAWSTSPLPSSSGASAPASGGTSSARSSPPGVAIPIFAAAMRSPGRAAPDPATG